MVLRPVAIGSALICLAGCADRSDVEPSGSGPVQSSTIHTPGGAQVPVVKGSLSARERSLATKLASDQQRKVTGTFVGATAFTSRGTPYDRGSACDVHKRFMTIRLVWNADANFTHSYPLGSPPDGPRKALLITVDPATDHVCEIGAQYRKVGAVPGETLLYGEWPDPADS